MTTTGLKNHNAIPAEVTAGSIPSPKSPADTDGIPKDQDHAQTAAAPDSQKTAQPSDQSRYLNSCISDKTQSGALGKTANAMTSIGPQKMPASIPRLHAQWRQIDKENAEAINVRIQWMTLLGCDPDEIHNATLESDLSLSDELDQLAAAIRLSRT